MARLRGACRRFLSRSHSRRAPGRTAAVCGRSQNAGDDLSEAVALSASMYPAKTFRGPTVRGNGGICFDFGGARKSQKRFYSSPASASAFERLQSLLEHARDPSRLTAGRRLLPSWLCFGLRRSARLRHVQSVSTDEPPIAGTGKREDDRAHDPPAPAIALRITSTSMVRSTVCHHASSSAFMASPKASPSTPIGVPGNSALAAPQGSRPSAIALLMQATIAARTCWRTLLMPRSDEQPKHVIAPKFQAA
ncbi:hypothetical protein OCOJLMKI_0142 [Methylobacterium iners]|uniref:Uncharacterized protein n=1 Tax=Methylobacterium iners TaxID=418707 RepID=A0ABQ4RTG0_9HYPH|nr:hypothetical protein OCOJLMKI_0142 [Methylobacterium iners]